MCWWIDWNERCWNPCSEGSSSSACNLELTKCCSKKIILKIEKIFFSSLWLFQSKIITKPPWWEKLTEMSDEISLTMQKCGNVAAFAAPRIAHGTIWGIRNNLQKQQHANYVTTITLKLMMMVYNMTTGHIDPIIMLASQP